VWIPDAFIHRNILFFVPFSIDMIQLFNKWISGFSTVKKTLGGREYRFRYQDKSVFFDAVGMLGEFAQRIKERDVQEVDLVCSQSQIESNFINPADKSLPKVISLFSKGRKELKVSRYVMRDGLHPLSIYHFESDGKVFGTFRRTYDYGSTLQSLGKKLAALNQNELELSKEKWMWATKDGPILFLEKFGHTQCWFFSDRTQLDFWKEDAV
jgi:hypothetical protein